MPRDLGAIIAPAIDVAKVLHQAQQRQRKIAAGEESIRKMERTQQEVRALMVEQGRDLILVRKTIPASGPKAGAWARHVADIGISKDTAGRYMALAGHVESAAQTGDVRQIPSFHEAGIDHRPRAADKPAPVRVTRAQDAPDDDLPVVSDEARAAAKDRETRAGQPDPIDVRADKLRQLHEAVAHAHGDIVKVRQRGIHLTDCTTSPDEFHRMKNLMIDVVNEFLAELDAAGVLDEKDQQRRRQLTLLSGGKP